MQSSTNEPSNPFFLFPVCFFFEQVVRRVGDPTNLENIESSNITRKLRKAFSLFNNEKRRSRVCVFRRLVYSLAPPTHMASSTVQVPPSWNGILLSFIDP